MSYPLAHTFRRLTLLGVTPELDTRHVERIRIVNTISLITLFMYLCYVVYGLVISDVLTSVIPIVMFIITFLSLYLNKIGRYSLAKSVIFCLTVTSIWFTHQVYTGNPAIMNFFFPILFCFSFLYNWREERAYFLFTGFYCFTVIMLTTLLPKHLFYMIELSAEVASITNTIHFILSVIVTILIMIITFRNKRIGDEEIHQQAVRAEKALKELETAQAKMIETEKMASLGFLIDGINHEINNPLNFIQGGAELISSELEGEGSEIVNIGIDAVNEGLERMKKLVSSLNYFNQSNDLKEKLDLHDILNNCLDITSMGMKEEHEFEKLYIDQPLFVLGNSGRLQQVFLNLLTNAHHAISKDGKIWVKTSVGEGLASISVIDNGAGIPEKIKNQIFDPFFTTKDPDTGTGLGLSISYSIIQEHQGNIKVDSREGEGTCVTVTLPLVLSEMDDLVKPEKEEVNFA